MKYTQTASYRAMSAFCIILTVISTLAFLYMFFYASFRPYFSEAKHNLQAPVFEAPVVKIPREHKKITITNSIEITNIISQTRETQTPAQKDIHKDTYKDGHKEAHIIPEAPAKAQVTEQGERVYKDKDIRAADRIFTAYELGNYSLASSLIVDFLADYPDSVYNHKVRSRCGASSHSCSLSGPLSVSRWKVTSDKRFS